MREEQGVVVSTADNLAQIKVGRHSECSGCGGCDGSKNLILEASNDLGAKNGDRVRFILQEEKMLQAAFMVFVFPLLMAAIGTILGWQWGLTDNSAVWGAVLFFCAGLLGVRWYDRRMGRKKAARPRIVEIMS